MLSKKDYKLQTDDELRESHAHWEEAVRIAGGWSSAYYAACQIEAIILLSNARELGLVNHYPVLRAYDGLPIRPDKGDIGHWKTSPPLHLDNKGM